MSQEIVHRPNSETAGTDISVTRFPPARASKILRQLSEAVDEREELRWAYAFGSIVRGEAFRDVDVAVMPQSGGLPSLVSLGRLIRVLQNAISETGCPLEVVDVRACPLPMKAAIVQQGHVLLDREPSARHFWEADVTLRWLDFEPVYSEQKRLRRKALLDD